MFLRLRKYNYLCTRYRKTDGALWCGSSAWLEYMPVTHGVAGSSPVRTAKEFTRFKIKNFCIIKRVKRRN